MSERTVVTSHVVACSRYEGVQAIVIVFDNGDTEVRCSEVGRCQFSCPYHTPIKM